MNRDKGTRRSQNRGKEGWMLSIGVKLLRASGDLPRKNGNAPKNLSNGSRKILDFALVYRIIEALEVAFVEGPKCYICGQCGAPVSISSR